MDQYFETLAKTNSRQKAKEAMLVYLRKRKLDVVGDERDYEDLNKEFLELKRLIKKEDILKKIIE